MNAQVVGAEAPRRLALVGVPNCGKTALFNRLTGSRQKVANYPGVTVERKEGSRVGAHAGRHYRLIDLPGTYSLLPAASSMRPTCGYRYAWCSSSPASGGR